MIRYTLIIILGLFVLTGLLGGGQLDEVTDNTAAVSQAVFEELELALESLAQDEEVSDITDGDEVSQNEYEIEVDPAESGSVNQVVVPAQSLVDDTQPPANMFQVTKVIDGDTIEVATDTGVKRVRYIGIDTPETVHPSQPIGCFGQEASERNKYLVAGKWVRLEKDISDTDRYGRWLRYVYVDDEFVNLNLVSDGYATAVTYPPDVQYVSEFRDAERAARAAKRGLWGSVCDKWVAPTAPPTNTPFPTTSQTPPIPSCNIKGNINRAEEKIYHFPGCKSYHQTVITEATGERWFCTEAEALEAGWRKAGNC